MTNADHQELYFADGGQPIVPLENDYPDGHFIPPHHHRRHQLLCALTGVVEVTTENGSWVMPPRRGMWLPAHTEHQVKILGRVLMHSLYFEPRLMADMPPHCQVLQISGFMRVLIAEAMGLSSVPDPRSIALATLLQHELLRQPHVALSLPLPQSASLAIRCRSFLASPNIHDTIDAWALSLGVSRRAFTRKFKAETGFSFVEWRQQACLVAALPRLVAGESITTVALDLGYENPAAFTTMFKRTLGFPPSVYLADAK